jgi:Ca-activated chloride channel family protein
MRIFGRGVRRSILALFAVAALRPALPTGGAAARPSQADVDPSPAAQQSPVIRVNSNLVAVPVSVTDAEGMLVRNLQARDFSIEENGKPVVIARIAEPGKTPLDLALLIDISGSLNQRFDFEKQAAYRFLNKLMRPEDSVAIFSVTDNPRLILPKTDNLSAAMQALESLRPTLGATAFYDAVVLAAQSLQKNARAQGRRVELVLSDGEDNASAISQFSDVKSEVLRNDCIFYSINPGGTSIHLNKISREGQEGMQRLASETGGVAFVPDSADNLDAIFDQIGAELQAQYLLEYYSTDAQGDDLFRRIVVRVPSRADLRIRARQGYYAPK